MKTFRITYSVITEESAQEGDFDSHGFLAQDEGPISSDDSVPPGEFTLREALDILRRHDSGRYSPQCDHHPMCEDDPPRWITVSDDPGYMPDDGVTELTIHLDRVSGGTAIRIAKLMEVNP